MGMKLSKIENAKIITQKQGSRIENRKNYREIKSGFWYEKAENWYAITSFANATRTVYRELQVLIQNQEEIEKILGDGLKIFYGIGNGDTESLLVDWDLTTKKHSEMIAIDSNKTFIQNFISGMKSLATEYPTSRIMILPLNMFFENMKKSNLNPPNRQTKNNIHVCLGNTIGNFETQEIFEIFSKNMDYGNFLIIGCQLLQNPKLHLRQYSENTLYNSWIREIAGCPKEEIEWRWNYKENRVEAWNGNILIFKSKKHSIERLNASGREHGLENIKNFEFKNSLISIFKKPSN